MRYLAAILVLLASSAAAASTVGTVNLAKLPEWQQATQTINARQTEFQADVNARDAAVKRLEEAKDKTAPEQRQDLTRRFAGYQERIDGLVKDREAKLAAAVKLVADARGLDVVEQAVWARDGVDVTDDVAKAYGGAVEKPQRSLWLFIAAGALAGFGVAVVAGLWIDDRRRRRDRTAKVPIKLAGAG